MTTNQWKPGKIMVVLHDERPEERVERVLEKYRPGQEIIYINSLRMPEKPLEGVSEVILNCNPRMYFYDKKGNYNHIPLSRLSWSGVDGSFAGFCKRGEKLSDPEFQPI